MLSLVLLLGKRHLRLMNRLAQLHQPRQAYLQRWQAAFFHKNETTQIMGCLKCLPTLPETRTTTQRRQPATGGTICSHKYVGENHVPNIKILVLVLLSPFLFGGGVHLPLTLSPNPDPEICGVLPQIIDPNLFKIFQGRSVWSISCYRVGAVTSTTPSCKGIYVALSIHTSCTTFHNDRYCICCM